MRLLERLWIEKGLRNRPWQTLLCVNIYRPDMERRGWQGRQQGQPVRSLLYDNDQGEVFKGGMGHLCQMPLKVKVTEENCICQQGYYG